MKKFLVHNSDKLVFNIDLSRILAGRICEIIQEGEHSVLLRNDSPDVEDWEPREVWVRRENGQFVDEKGCIINP